jgi:CRISPR-associated protein Csd1
MILKALADYYQRLFDDPNIEIAPPGFELKSIDYIVVIDNEGKFINFRDVRKGTGRRRNGRPTLVPKGVKRASNILSNLLWDTVPYSLGRALPDKNRDFEELSTRAVEQHAAFVEKIEQIFEGSDDCGIQALLTFLHAADLKSKTMEEIFLFRFLVIRSLSASGKRWLHDSLRQINRKGRHKPVWSTVSAMFPPNCILP